MTIPASPAAGPPVVQLPDTRVDDVVTVLCDAFADYPVMRFVLGAANAPYDARLRRLIELFTMARVLRGEPMLGIERDGSLAAAAILSFPVRSHTPAAFTSLRTTIWKELGEEAERRYETCSVAWKQFAMGEPHVHVNMIGVRRSWQRTGLARQLLHAVQRISDDDPESRGITLSTEDPANLAFYERHGYRIVGRAIIAPGIQTWGFFRAR